MLSSFFTTTLAVSSIYFSLTTFEVPTINPSQIPKNSHTMIVLLS